MPTKLSRYAEGIIEAVWLTALIVVPVFFNVYSSRIFEPDKATLLRSLALLALLAWIVKLVDQGGLVWDLPRNDDDTWLKTLWRTPMVPGVLLLVIVYIVATIFSVSPRISFWGSYQRLQGTYTTLSYIVIFAALAGNLRRREQVERLIITVVLASLPVGLYGILQRFEIDPVPWGGDVSRRIAANMGNSIFVAAYLIMAFPMTLGRIVDSFTAIMKEDEENLPAHVARGTVYVFAAAIQLIALYMSSSRGPLLGFVAGSFFMFVLLSLYWRKRWLTLSSIGAALAIGAFLIVFNIPGGPFESLQGRTGIGRLGNVFQTDSGTGLVRVLIWDGTSELVLPHEPLEYPDGSTDSINFLRPLIGYGPEAMYVAYNPFYPPELANVEARNASPDRSHNETWDSMVITGFLGLVVYLSVFTSAFYFGLKWLGMIETEKQRNLFLGLLFGAGALGAVGFMLIFGAGFFGVGLPFGMLVGLLGYLTITSLFTEYKAPETEGQRARALTLIIVLSAIIAHYTEIHFGIAIVSTRTYFWTYAGVLFAVGYVMTHLGAYGEIPGVEIIEAPQSTRAARRAPSRSNRQRSRRTGRAGRRTNNGQPAWTRHAVIAGAVVSIILATLGYDYISNPNGSGNTISGIVLGSLTTLPNKDFAQSPGILVLIITLWLAAGILLTAEFITGDRKDWLKIVATTLGIAAVLSLLYWLWHAMSLIAVASPSPAGSLSERVISQSGRLEALLSNYYVMLFVIILIAAAYLPTEWPSDSVGRSSLGYVAVPIALILLGVLVTRTNLRIIHADITFKLADPFARGNDQATWEVAIDLYNRATDFAPSEDHYYLFLGRGYLERTRLVLGTDPILANSLMEDAEQDLEFAQSINPLNTDHTANLARLHRFWAGMQANPNQRLSLLEEASDYYARAVVLSPNNAVIWNEWGILQASDLGNPELGLETLEHSLAIDPYYNATPAILAETYFNLSRGQEEAVRSDYLEESALLFTQAISLTKDKEKHYSERYNYFFNLASVYVELDQFENAIDAFDRSFFYAKVNQQWRPLDAMARISFEMGEIGDALSFAQNALIVAPEGQQGAIQQFIEALTQSDT
jgi:tetratricopeptide (TPR) repeat protein